MKYTVTAEDGTKVMDFDTGKSPIEVEAIIIEGFITYYQTKTKFPPNPGFGAMDPALLVTM